MAAQCPKRPAGAFGARPGATVRSLSRVRCKPRQGHATGAGSGAPGEVTGPGPGARVMGRFANGTPESTRGSQAALWPTWARTLLANQISGPASATLGGGDVPICPLLLTFSNSRGHASGALHARPADSSSAPQSWWLDAPLTKRHAAARLRVRCRSTTWRTAAGTKLQGERIYRITSIHDDIDSPR